MVIKLDLDMKKISVIPNSEEKFISFSKHVTNNFSIRFINTLRLMTSSLSTLLENLLTSEFKKFREIAKHFNAENLSLVTRKSIYPYEYKEAGATHLPKKTDFYSTLTKSHTRRSRV